MWIELVEELKKIDEKSLKIVLDNKQSKFYYDFLEKNSVFLFKIFNELENYINKKPYLNLYIKHINDHITEINYVNFKIIKNSKLHSLVIIACSIAWAFNETSRYKYTTINDCVPHDSYSLINESIDFIDMFKTWNYIYGKNILLSNISKRDHNSNMYRIYSILIHSKIISSETTYIKWLNKKTTSYLSIYFKRTRIIKVYTKPFEYKKIQNNSVLLGDHYSISWELFIPNDNNNNVFALAKDEVLKIMSKLYTNIDFKHYKEIVEIYYKNHLLKQETVEKDYEKFLNEYRLAIKQNNKNLIINLSKKLSIYQKAIELKDILEIEFKENENFFLPWNYDFRGRTYFLSDISFTFNKEFRWCMYQGCYFKVEDFKPKWHPYNNRINKLLDSQIELMNNLDLKIYNKESVHVMHSIIWLLISLGEINKAKIGRQIHISEFIKEGIDIFNNYEKIEAKLNYEEKIKAYSLIKAIKEYKDDINIKPIKKRLISKDAPASVFQHLILNFGWKDKKWLKMVNLSSEDEWFDVYTFFIEEWKKQLSDKIIENIDKKEKEKILLFFGRGSLKKTIMTSNYGVGYDSAESYFKDIILDLKPEEIEETKLFITKYWKEIQKLFENFFEYTSNLLIIKNDPNTIINYIESNNGLIHLLDAIVDVNYYEKNKYVVDIQNEGKRYTKSFKAISNKKNYQKEKTSARANFIHTLDAALTRWICIRHEIYTIHDCFLIDPANVTYLISLVNEGMGFKFHNFEIINENEKEKIEIFSPFILL